MVHVIESVIIFYSFILEIISDLIPCAMLKPTFFPTGKYLKLTIPELLQNQCRNCDPQQRMRAGRLVSHIQQNFPKQWEDAVKKFQVSQSIISSFTILLPSTNHSIAILPLLTCT